MRTLNGDTMPPNEKRERLLEAASAVLERADGNQLNAVCLNKAIFYLDLVSLRDIGDTVTHSPFVALKQGPVVAHYKKRLIQKLVELGIAEEKSDGNSKPVKLINHVGEYRYIPKELLPAVEKIAKMFSGNSSAKASAYSHKNPGWKKAYREGLGADTQAMPINLFIAMQQICDDDPWMSEQLTDAETQAIQIAEDSLEGTPW